MSEREGVPVRADVLLYWDKEKQKYYAVATLLYATTYDIVQLVEKEE